VKAYDPRKEFTPELFGDIQFPPETISLIGSSTGRGEITVSLINMARNALDSGRKVLFVSLRENQRQIYTRLVLSTAYQMAQADRITLSCSDPTADLFRIVREESSTDEGGTQKDFILYCDKAREKIKSANSKETFLLYDGCGESTRDVLDAIRRYAGSESIVFIDDIKGMPLLDIFNTTVTTGVVTICGARFDCVSNEERDLLEQYADVAIELDWDGDVENGDVENGFLPYRVLKNRNASFNEDVTFDLEFIRDFSHMERA
jgi:hypothetical protein